MNQLEETYPLTAEKMAELNAFLLYAGTHPSDENGWQVKYQFGTITATVYWTPETDGIEMTSTAWREKRDYLTGSEIYDLLVSLKIKYS